MPVSVPPLTLRQMRYLVALEETAHFREAAESCGISQPSLSVQIKTLEDALGLTLVERGRGPVRLTLAGREVSSRSRDILDATQGILDLSVTLQSGLGGTLRLGTSATLGPYLMPHVVGDLHRSHPDLRLYIREASPRELLRELNDGMHDLILTQLPVSGAALTTSRLFREPLSVALPVDHPLAEKEMLDGPDLSDQTILSLSPSYTLHDQIAAVCLETGATLSRDYEGTSLDALRQMVAMGMGVTFLPTLYVKSEIENRAQDVVVRPFRGRRFSRSVGLVWRSATGAASAYERLAQLIRDTAGRFPDLVIEG
ncbi:LysR family transcriptional regulator [Roseobacter sp. HKCCD9010]|jgi:LysR family transcriptional regulator, hydrogen peroxide-inducible genes activator|uniref:hydrogen peroxide-inducible genes activator n=2 Tax=unclassified Roseobacter TaxID=196798 RepID=UPI00119A7C2F|nr:MULTISPECIES: hydrogen peroxide-inducible genes activator [unclassified Roseobacter]MBF9048847.1 LysR family transcriptional regulator [Rhodobacterales bacterium HKCCD4356]NNV37271.1 LysR family transcriptional regulator [Roseobacter sp. HKCCD9054]NNV45479.1 LysR family transcriptional regulator [Roseobacter sp. HKCCD6265]NNV76012.1 LysR family transcriptional regulator [Roseobacter sp. HKCCD6135]NNV84100.1 LysR family transcriptional regulator [Roseobacter sp. HKCCD8414]NNW05387.1 LysR fa